MDKIDYKKTEKHLYLPKSPAIVQVPEMVFFAVDGQGDPNTSPAYPWRDCGGRRRPALTASLRRTRTTSAGPASFVSRTS